MKIPKGVFVYESFTQKSGWQVDAIGPMKKLLAFKKAMKKIKPYLLEEFAVVKFK